VKEVKKTQCLSFQTFYSFRLKSFLHPPQLDFSFVKTGHALSHVDCQTHHYDLFRT
jgi:hypothetical protein